MAPNAKIAQTITTENVQKSNEITICAPWKYEIMVEYVVFFIYVHLAGAYGLFLLCTTAKWITVYIGLFLYFAGMFGLTAGAHRLFTHKSFKANLPLQCMLMVFHSLTFQKSLVTWITDHRLHHKYTDTDADPHNINRGFFFSHMGWLLVKYHPEVMKAKSVIDMSDVKSNPILMFQKRNAKWFIPTMAFIIPTVIPWMFGESFTVAWHVSMLRFIANLNVASLGNSLAHTSGYRPYDKTLSARNSWPLTIASYGEGFHNFHHVFPWDYRSGEVGNDPLNFVTWFIDFFVKIGWAYDLKTATEDVVSARSKRTGDGTDLWGRSQEY